MMTIKYRIPCSESDIFVLEKENGFHLTIGSSIPVPVLLDLDLSPEAMREHLEREASLYGT